MPYRFLEDVATADIAFQAWGRSLEEVFGSAADATMNVMVESLESIQPVETCDIRLHAESAEMLLFDFLQELIFLKDTRRLLLRVARLSIQQKPEGWDLDAGAIGEPLDPSRHQQRVDIKAVTFHQFCLEKAGDRWQCRVILDV